MNSLVFLGLWILCGCIASIFVYAMDDNKESREEVYATNLYIFFMMLFWPVTVYFFLRFTIAALTKKKPKEGE